MGHTLGHDREAVYPRDGCPAGELVNRARPRLARPLLGYRPGGTVPNTADSASVQSVRLGTDILDELGIARGATASEHPNSFERTLRRELQTELDLLGGSWQVDAGSIRRFEQYRHLKTAWTNRGCGTIPEFADRSGLSHRRGRDGEHRDARDSTLARRRICRSWRRGGEPASLRCWTSQHGFFTP